MEKINIYCHRCGKYGGSKTARLIKELTGTSILIESNNGNGWKVSGFYCKDCFKKEKEK